MSKLVSIIALCYNHSQYLIEALDSIKNQSYLNFELLIVDDASTDQSVEMIESWIDKNKIGRLIKNEGNIGNCASFNKAFFQSTGEYIVDFSLDDVMHSDKLQKQVYFFEQQSIQVGIVYTNVELIDSIGIHKGYMYTAQDKKYEGKIFNQLIARYTINPISMMVRKQVFIDLNGYDETLSYEDFDFWIRSSYRYDYKYLDIVSCKKRLHSKSLSKLFSKWGTQAIDYSTYKVCLKINWLRSTEEQKKALIRRIQYELSFSLRKFKWSMCYNYLKLYASIVLK